jgi:hypothetical protein
MSEKNEEDKTEVCLQIKALGVPTTGQGKVATVSAPLYPSLALSSTS